MSAVGYISLLALIGTAIFLLYKYITRNYEYWKGRGFDFIEPSFPFGNFRNVILGKQNLGFFVETIYNSTKENSVGFWIFGTPHLLIRSPKLIRHILVKDFSNFHDRTIFTDTKIDPIGTKTLLLLKNPEWKLTRNKITPVFTTSKLRSMIPLINKSAEDMRKYMQKKGDDFVLDAKELCAKYATDMIISCAFGIDSKSFEDEDAPFRKVGREMFAVNFSNGIRFLSYFLMPTIVKLFKLPVYNKKSTDFLKEVFWKAITEREKSKIKRNDLIDIIIMLKQEEILGDSIKFEGDTVVAQALQFYIAGFETTSSTISYIFYELSRNHEVQKKARDEITSTLSKFGEFSYEAILDMKYLDKIIAETLRKYPPLPFLDRRCTEEYKVPESDLVIERGTPVYISMLGVHYDPEFYPNPHVFDPERFSEINCETRPPYTYLPFGYGPRNCIGERFGVAATKICLAQTLMDYCIEECKDSPQTLTFNQFTIILQPLKGLPMTFKKL